MCCKTLKHKIKEDEIKVAALKDFGMQTKYNNAHDRVKGFIEGAKWALRNINKSQGEGI